MLRAISFVVMVALTVFVTRVPGVHAQAQQPATGGGDPRLESARREMERGQELFLQQRYADAAQAFISAYAQMPFAAFLFNAGVAFERHGDTAQAIDYFRRYIAAEPNAGDRAEVEARIARLTPGAPTPPSQTPDQAQQAMKSLLTVRTDPEGARVTLRQGSNVVATGPTPFAQTLDAGDYSLTVEHPDYRTATERVSIRPGRVYVVIMNLSQGEFLGYLRVVTDIPGASVYIDDREQGEVGRTPYANSVSTGRHRIIIERPGYRPITREIEVGVGEDVTLRVDLTRVDQGRLRVVGNIRGARVYVDDRPWGRVPYEGDVPAGPARVRVEADGYKTWEGMLQFQRGQVIPIRVTMQPSPGRGSAWVTASLSVLFFGGGIVTGIMSSSRFDELETLRNDGLLDSNDSRIDVGQILALVADGCFIVGTLLAGLATYYFLRNPGEESSARILRARDWAYAPGGRSLVARRGAGAIARELARDLRPTTEPPPLRLRLVAGAPQADLGGASLRLEF
ncbi:MAG: PEGA domain-containing protein [Deltaproteobacteria bacterium]|nr:PEGA domain-containing protein [Deltaproteobacteria bacterium]